MWADSFSLEEYIVGLVVTSILALIAFNLRSSPSLLALLVSIAVACIVYLPEMLSGLSLNTKRALALWGSLEFSFWVVDIYRKRVYFEHKPGNIEASRERFPKEQRKRYLEEIIKYEAADVEKGRKWCEGWFYNTKYEELKSGNLFQIVAWAWFDVFLKDGETSHKDLTEEDTKEVLHCVDQFQKALGPVEPGFNYEAKCMRQSLDPIAYAVHRPLIVYAVFDFLPDIAASILMRLSGFKRKSSGHIRYWHKEAAGNSESEVHNVTGGKPTVFLHGIGIGILPYVHVLRSLSADGRELFVPEQPNVRVSLLYYLQTLMRVSPINDQQFIDSLEEMLSVHGKEKAEFVGHSYGTIPVSWMIKQRPVMVERAVLLDPVSIFLHKPDMCRSFLYMKAMNQGIVKDILSYVFNKDPGIVFTLMRNFYWSTNTLWFSEIMAIDAKTTIIVSEDDEYIPVAEIMSHIGNLNATAEKEGKEMQFKAHLCKAMPHGGFLACKDTLKDVLKLILEA